MTFIGDATTGLYLSSPGVLGLSAGAGTGGVFLDSTQVGTGKSGNQLYYTNGAFLNPVGMVTDFAGGTAPAGWYLCFGQAISRTNYPELFNTIGTTYGIGDGSTTFNLPDCRGRISAGVDNMGGTAANRITSAGSGIAGTTLGATGGAQNQIIAQANLPSVNLSSAGLAAASVSVVSGGINGGTALATASAGAGSINANFQAIVVTTTTTISGTVPLGGSGTALTTMPPVIMFNKIIFAGRP